MLPCADCAVFDTDARHWPGATHSLHLHNWLFHGAQDGDSSMCFPSLCSCAKRTACNRPAYPSAHLVCPPHTRLQCGQTSIMGCCAHTQSWPWLAVKWCLPMRHNQAVQCHAMLLPSAVCLGTPRQQQGGRSSTQPPPRECPTGLTWGLPPSAHSQDTCMTRQQAYPLVPDSHTAAAAVRALGS
jgi:hypothetical protein